MLSTLFLLGLLGLLLADFLLLLWLIDKFSSFVSFNGFVEVTNSGLSTSVPDISKFQYDDGLDMFLYWKFKKL